MRRIKFKVDPYSRKLLLNDPEEPTAVDIEMGNYKTMLIEIDELSRRIISNFYILRQWG